MTLSNRELAIGALALAVPAALLAVKYLTTRALHQRSAGKKAAVILAGCGYLDGSETTEAIAVLVSLSELGFETTVFAPEGMQHDVVDHQSQKPLGYAPRSIAQESARLTRGQVQPLGQLDAAQFACLVVPGGFGAAKNLCNWASAASPQECVVRPEVQLALEQFHAQKKPIALCCIAPVLAARVLGKNNQLKLTVGGVDDNGACWPYGGTVQQIKSLGVDAVLPRCVSEVVVDKSNLLVSTPAYMSGTAHKHEVFFAVREMIKQMAWMV